MYLRGITVDKLAVDLVKALDGEAKTLLQSKDALEDKMSLVTISAEDMDAVLHSLSEKMKTIVEERQSVASD